jgi:hypothetical protein
LRKVRAIIAADFGRHWPCTSARLADHDHIVYLRFEYLATEDASALLIISIHIPKAAGQSFRARLHSTFSSRALFDYGDWIGLDTPDIVSRREVRKAAVWARRDEIIRNYDVIHGHFAADKYLGLFPTAGFAAFFREPYQQAVSHYEFILRHPEINHPAVRTFHEERMSLPEFVAAFPRMQSRHLGRVSIEDLAMVGIMEQYERGVTLFEAVFGCKLAPEISRENVNPNRQGDIYPIDESVRQAVDTHNACDIELYHRACERFAQLCARYGL